MKTLILTAALCFSFAAPAHVAAPAGAQSAAPPAAPPAVPLIVAGLAAALWVARRRLRHL